METEYPPSSHCQPGRIRPGNGTDARLRTLGRNRTAACDPVGVVGWVVRGQAGDPYGIHHHGEQQTVAYVLSGICEVRWGASGEYAARAKAGDFIHVPAFLPHMEIEPIGVGAFHWVVVRSTSIPIVVNLPDRYAGHRRARPRGAASPLVTAGKVCKRRLEGWTNDERPRYTSPRYATYGAGGRHCGSRRFSIGPRNSRWVPTCRMPHRRGP